MQTTKIKLSSETILKMDANKEIDAVIVDGRIFIPLFSGLEISGTEKEKPQMCKPEPVKTIAPKVVDDTVAEAPAAKPVAKKVVVPAPVAAPAPAPVKAAPTRKAPVPVQEVEDAEEVEEQGELAFDELSIGLRVMVQLTIDGVVNNYAASVVAPPKGGKAGSVYVKFDVDGDIDYLREGDKVFPIDFEF